MLTGMQYEIIQFLSAAFPDNRSHLDYFWPCSQYYGNANGILNPPINLDTFAFDKLHCIDKLFGIAGCQNNAHAVAYFIVALRYFKLKLISLKSATVVWFKLHGHAFIFRILIWKVKR
jgi:hypothetical protein